MLISDLKDSIGYGGMIHNFKNYLLRSEDKFFEEGMLNLQKSFTIIENFQSLDSVSQEEHDRMTEISLTLKEYQENLNELKSIKDQKVRIKDNRLKVDDSKTVNSFNWFKESLLKEKESLVKGLNVEVENAQYSLLLSMLVSSLFFLFILFYGKRFIDKTNKKLEDERQSRIHTARLSAIGQMSGSIAHEINNPLAILKGTSQMMQTCLKKDPLPKDLLLSSAETINQTVKRIADIISGLLSLSRDEKPGEYKDFSIDSLLMEILSLCKDRYTRHEIEIEVPKTTNISIYGQKVQIAQVLINLLNNSADAIKNQNEKWVKIEVDQTKDIVIISVEDSGLGVSEEVKQKLMTPFFTTKKDGEGTGIGLSISKNIIENHSGKFYFDEKSKNTKFVIELPKRK